MLITLRGRIIEQGPHKELMQLNGNYASLYTMQTKRYLENEVQV